MMTDRLLTAREWADRLRVSPETVLRWYRRGDFEGVAIRLPSGQVRFREDRGEAWLEERATTPRGKRHPTPLAAAPGVSYLSSPNPNREEV
jgi:predicted DNA-binding transcriptional regulator AlpA